MSDLKLSSLVRKCVFYRPELAGMLVPHGTLKLRFWIQNWSKLKDRAQRVDQKKGVIRLVMFTPRVMAIKMSKMAGFMYFLLDTAKNQSVWARYLSASVRSYLAFSENTMGYVLRSYH